MSRYAIIENNIVSNVIEADQEFIDQHYPDAILIDGLHADLYFNYVNGEFTEPTFEDRVNLGLVTPTPAEEPTNV